MDATKIVVALAAVALAALALFLNPLPGSVSVDAPAGGMFPVASGAVSLGERRASMAFLPEVFHDLPPPPADFNAMVSLYIAGLVDERFISEKYYLQPEFYPSFNNNGFAFWLSPPLDYWGVYGHGAFPTRKTIRLSPGESADVRFFFHSGYGVRTWRGHSLAVEFGGDAASHLSASIREPVFLLGPDFPRFRANWARAVDFTVSALPDAVPGTYTLGINVGPPPEEQSRQWHESYGQRYVDAGFVARDRPPFRLTVIVV